MSDWLHCNKCLAKFQPDIKLYLVECAHVFCENCIKQVHDSKCLVCGKSNSFIPIDKEMHASAQPFFVPFESHLKKVIEVYNFQTMHRQRLYQSQTQKYQYLKKEVYNYHQKVKGLMSENKMMRSMLLNSNRNTYPTPGGFVTSTPSVTNDDMSQFDNRSVVSSIPYSAILPTKPVPGYASRISHDGNLRGVPIPHNQPVSDLLLKRFLIYRTYIFCVKK